LPITSLKVAMVYPSGAACAPARPATRAGAVVDHRLASAARHERSQRYVVGALRHRRDDAVGLLDGLPSPATRLFLAGSTTAPASRVFILVIGSFLPPRRCVAFFLV
jgi:hypothetical protein